MTIRKFVAALSVAFLALGFGLPARAQTTFGSITGAVTDPSGAAIPGARVTVINQATGSQQRITTDAKGVFNAPDLNPGTYEVQVEAPGFKLQQRKGIALYAHNSVNVDVRLSVGETTTVVQVKAAPPVINTASPTLSYSQTASQLAQAPSTTHLQDTNQYFALYTPGVGIDNGGGVYVYGVRPMDTRVSNDGIVEMADADGIGGGPIGPASGSISEVTTMTANASAEYKDPANIIVVTKSGTNQFHGDINYDWNGSALNARNFFSSTVPFNNFNDFSGSIGGPIKKNKLFFFADYEGLRSHGQSVLNADVPLPAWRNGDFSGLSQTIVNPFTGQAFQGNKISPNLISRVSQNIQSFFFPLPNFGPPGLQSGNWRDLLPSTSDSNTGDGRIDYNIGSGDRVFGRFTYHANNAHEVNGGDLPAAIYNVNRPTTSAFLSWTHVFSPTLLNEFRTGVSRNNEVEGPALVGSDVLKQIGLEGINAPVGLPGQPIIGITGISNTNAHSGPVHNLETNFQWVDDVSWTKGPHFFKFGADIIRDQVTGFFNSNSVYGDLSFTGVYSGSPYADFLLGIPQTSSENALPPVPYFRGTLWSFYAQDQYKATRRLTLNYGLRYELDGPYYDKNGAIYSFDPTNLSIVVPQKGLSMVSPLFPKTIPVITAQQAGYPATTLLKYQKFNFYPRIGVAYQLTADGKTAIRAGYGIYSNTFYSAVVQKGGPFAGSESFDNSITGGVPLISFPNPFSAGGKAGSFQNVSAINPNVSVPYTQQWNVTLERQFGEFGIAISYIGSHAVDLPYLRNLNQPAPSTTPFTKSRYLLSSKFSRIGWIENGANEEYNALQVSAMKTVGRNLTLNSGWTWARDLTDQTDVKDAYNTSIIQNQFDRAAEWGNNPYTPTQHFYAVAVYALPVGSGQYFLKSLPPVANEILGGWRVSGIALAQTGLWFTPSFSGFDPSNTNTKGGRPDAVAGVPLYPANRSITEWFNPAAFRIPGCPDSTPACSKPADVGAFGNAALYQLEAPPLDNLDLGLFKDFRITESKTLQFEALFSDALNHPHFGFPSANISSPKTVGQITSTIGGNYVRGSSDEREINFTLRFEF
ncbi:MAG: carboxypeptidase regulatory-like domain-containing protein [Terriglobia bacterium]